MEEVPHRNRNIASLQKTCIGEWNQPRLTA